MKICNKCNLEKEYSEFYKNSRHKDRHMNQCKECKKQYAVLYREFWMNWQNRGLYNGDFNYGWDIDHIIPVSLAESESDIIKLNHYTNLQPLCSKVNRNIKKNKLENEIY